ncbi:hypothetical protein K438DRAFT_539178 [Mycena galopus ATCC 62051]|nr:hypothetical protein K438DRAFT_539178 [Mycena galopus ATCC 62051]
MGTPKKSTKKMQGQLHPRMTHSSKAWLASDPMENTALLTEQLRSLGLYAVPTIGDGNCLFHVLSDQLYSPLSRHPQFQCNMCDWIVGHKAQYEPFVEDNRGLNVHLQCMRKNGGSHLTSLQFFFLALFLRGCHSQVRWSEGTGALFPSFFLILATHVDAVCSSRP